MRKVTLSLTASLDNYIARPDGGYGWILTDQGHRLTEFFQSVDVVFLGRKSHDAMVRAGRPSYNRMKNYVFSRNRSGSGAGGVEFVGDRAKELVETLRAQPGKDLWLAGGGELVRSFLGEGLVDEIQLAIQPVLLGEGLPLFPPGFPQSSLRLTRCHQYSNGVVALNYDVVR